MFLFQYIKQIPEMKLKSEFAAYTCMTLEGWQLHLEKACLSWKTPTEKHLEDNFQQNKMVVLYS